MMIGYRIILIMYPSLSDALTNYAGMSVDERKVALEKAPKCALFMVVLIRFIGCTISCTLFSYYAPNPSENEFIFLFQFMIMVLWIIGEYCNQSQLPYPRWYNKYELGYIPWIPGVLIGHILGLCLR